MGVRILTALLLLAGLPATAQFKADVEIAAISNAGVAYRMDQSLTKVIDEINTAFTANRIPVNPDRKIIDDSAFSKICAFWKTSPFRVTQVQLLLDGLTIRPNKTSRPDTCYQVRGIPVYIAKEPTNNTEREIGFDFDASGRLTDFFLCLELNSGTIYRGNSNPVMEAEHRFQLSSFLENFRTAYNIKDLDMIGKMFSEDALIITGKVIKTLPAARSRERTGVSWRMPAEQVIYVKQKKEEYVRSLARVFARNEYLKVEFDDIEWVQNEDYPDVYGVTLKQTWKSDSYSDEGWLFMLIDYRNGDDPLIHVRTWQPAYLNGKVFPKDQVFGPGNFIYE